MVIDWKADPEEVIAEVNYALADALHKLGVVVRFDQVNEDSGDDQYEFELKIEEPLL